MTKIKEFGSLTSLNLIAKPSIINIYILRRTFLDILERN